MVLIYFISFPFIKKCKVKTTGPFFNYKLFINLFYSPTRKSGKWRSVGSRTSVPVSQERIGIFGLISLLVQEDRGDPNERE